MKGWIKLHRQLADNDLWLSEPFTKAQAWIDLILHTNHKDGVVNIRGNMIKIKRGQLGWSELTMAKRWTWSKNKVRRYLKWLETEQQIEQQKLFKITTILTILNYNKYQDDTTDDTTERQQKDNRRYTNKNVKNDKNDKNTIKQPEVAGVNELLGIFKENNPAISFGNKTQRKACESLISERGLDNAIKITRYAISVQGEKFAPTVTTPHQLWNNYTKLQNFYTKKSKPLIQSL